MRIAPQKFDQLTKETDSQAQTARKMKLIWSA